MPRRIKNTVVMIAAITGGLTIAWTVASLSFGLTIVAFRTGSMSPTIPAGSAAIAVPISAPDIEVGDVITVTPEGKSLPVTHRVVSVQDDPAVPDGRLIVMRGDANDTNDRAPYAVTKALRVVASAPYLGRVFAVSRTPLALAFTTAIVACLVTWALWPAKERNEELEKKPQDA